MCVQQGVTWCCADGIPCQYVRETQGCVWKLFDEGEIHLIHGDLRFEVLVELGQYHACHLILVYPGKEPCSEDQCQEGYPGNQQNPFQYFHRDGYHQSSSIPLPVQYVHESIF